MSIYEDPRLTKAVILPTPGDPFLLTLWFTLYERWSNEIDSLIVQLNTDSNAETVGYIQKIIRRFPNADIQFTGHQIEHGQAIYNALQTLHDDVVMLVEDDGLIFKAGAVREGFRMIIEGDTDIVGSRRGSCGLWLYSEASAKWGLDNSGYGDNGPNFWPCFLFTSRERLVAAGPNYAARFWKAGEMVGPLGMSAPEDQAADTLVEASLKLMSAKPRVHYTPQYHSMTDDYEDYVNKRNLFDGKASWLHVGSLSSGFHGLLRPQFTPPKTVFQTDTDKRELERRVAFFSIGADLAKKHNPPAQLLSGYLWAIDRLVSFYNLNQADIDTRIRIYRELMNV